MHHCRDDDRIEPYELIESSLPSDGCLTPSTVDSEPTGTTTHHRLAKGGDHIPPTRLEKRYVRAVVICSLMQAVLGMYIILCIYIYI